MWWESIQICKNILGEPGGPLGSGGTSSGGIFTSQVPCGIGARCPVNVAPRIFSNNLIR